MKAPAKALLLLSVVLVIVALIAGWSSYSNSRARLKRQEQRRQLGAVRRYDDLAVKWVHASNDDLLEKVNNASGFEQEQAVTMLAERRDARLHSLCLGMLKDASPRRRKLAAEGLGPFQDAGDFSALQSLLRDTDPDVRSEAAVSLGRLHDQRAFPLLQELFAGDTNSDVHRGATAGLALLGPEGLKIVLSKIDNASLSYDQFVLVSGLTIAVKQGDPAVVGALAEICRNHASAERRIEAAQALAKIHDPAAEAAFAAALHDRDDQVRSLALYALPDDARAIPLLQEMVHDPQPKVRVVAGKALRGNGDPRVDDMLDLAVKEKNLPLIAGAYDFLLDRTDNAAAELLIGAMRSYGDLDMAKALLNHQNSNVSKAAKDWAKERGYQIYYQYIPGK